MSDDYVAAGLTSPHRKDLKMNISPEFVAVGGNRNPAAADWDVNGSGVLAFGADNSIALWDPQVGTHVRRRGKY